jgi:hypothetical protein
VEGRARPSQRAGSHRREHHRRARSDPGARRDASDPGGGEWQPLGPGGAHRRRRASRPLRRPGLAGDPQLLAKSPAGLSLRHRQSGGRRLHRSLLSRRGRRGLAGRRLARAHAGRGQPAALRPPQSRRHRRRRPRLLAGLRVFRRAQPQASRPQYPDSFHGKRLHCRRGHRPALSRHHARPAHGADARSLSHHDGRQPTLQARARLLFLHRLLAAGQRAAGQHQRLVGRSRLVQRPLAGRRAARGACVTGRTQDAAPRRRAAAAHHPAREHRQPRRPTHADPGARWHRGGAADARQHRHL